MNNNNNDFKVSDEYSKRMEEAMKEVRVAFGGFADALEESARRIVESWESGITAQKFKELTQGSFEDVEEEEDESVVRQREIAYLRSRVEKPRNGRESFQEFREMVYGVPRNREIWRVRS